MKTVLTALAVLFGGAKAYKTHVCLPEEPPNKEAEGRFSNNKDREKGEAMTDLVKQSYQMVELSVIDVGTFRFCLQYQHLVISQDRWFQMTPKQRQHQLAKVVSTLEFALL